MEPGIGRVLVVLVHERAPQDLQQVGAVGEDEAGHIPRVQLDHRDHGDRLGPDGRAERLVVVRFGAHRPGLARRPQQGPANGAVARARVPGPGVEEGDRAGHFGQLRKD
ncbi:hypothetical protein [Streptomyces sp. NBC_01238]|uniref:hypothetical protein n=1 Tax=Streptomyces sp. NBC_01238 TaxID=2903791 RepID=UPI00386D9C1D